MSSLPKSRLGRGLGAIISGGGAAPKAKADTQPAFAKPAPVPAPVAKAAAKSAAPIPAPAPAAPPAPTPVAPPAVDAKAGALAYLEIAVANVEPNPYQPRREFRPEQIHELAESIRAEGLLQPIVVRDVGGRFQLVAGERRWRAFQLLKLKTIPARVVKAGNASAASMALIENLQRADLNPVEEAHGYASLVRDFDLTQEAVSERVGKARATVANSLRLLGLDNEIQGYLGTGLLSTGHAKVLLGIENKAEQLVIARRVIAEGLSVRATEAVVTTFKRTGADMRKPGSRNLPAADATAIADIERRLGSFLNTRVALQHTKKKGRIVIEYAGNEDLQRILDKVGVGS